MLLTRWLLLGSEALPPEETDLAGLKGAVSLTLLLMLRLVGVRLTFHPAVGTTHNGVLRLTKQTTATSGTTPWTNSDGQLLSSGRLGRTRGQ